MLKFTLLGFPVTVHWMFWVVSALLGGGFEAKVPQDFQRVLVWVAAVFISIIWHELGHALLMRRYGGRPSILLYGFGGLAQGNVRLTRSQDIVVSLAGPVFGLVLGGVIYALASFSTNDPWLVVRFVSDMIWINIAWSIINLLPVLPLDGGRVSEALLGPSRFRTAVMISVVTAALVAAWFIFAWGSIFNGIFFAMLAVRNFQRLQGNPSPYWPGM